MTSRPDAYAFNFENIMQSHSIISAEKVIGTSVYNAQGDKLGSIDDVMIDKVSGQVRYAVLEFGGFLGMGTDRYPLPWQKLKYDTQMDGYMVPMTKEQLDAAPKYNENDRMESFDEPYGRKVSSYYGIDY